VECATTKEKVKPILTVLLSFRIVYAVQFGVFESHSMGKCMQENNRGISILILNSCPRASGTKN
jgi:hypothetical protein